MEITHRTATADVRAAGRQNEHRVYVNGVPVAKRRSERVYAYAICRWITTHDGDRIVEVSKWSGSPKATRDTFPVKVTEATS